MEFIEEYARVDDESEDENITYTEENKVRCQSDNHFVIDDEKVDHQTTEFKMLHATEKRSHEMPKELRKEFECSNPKNFVPDCFNEVDYEYDTSVGFEKRNEKFKSDLKIFKESAKESFYFAILYGTFFKLNQTDDNVDVFVEDRDMLESVFRQDFFACLEVNRDSLYLELNLNTFEIQY